MIHCMPSTMNQNQPFHYKSLTGIGNVTVRQQSWGPGEGTITRVSFTLDEAVDEFATKWMIGWQDLATGCVWGVCSEESVLLSLSPISLLYWDQVGHSFSHHRHVPLSCSA